MLALTTQELATIMTALIALVIIGFYRLLSAQADLRERIARLEEAVRSIFRKEGDE